MDMCAPREPGICYGIDRLLLANHWYCVDRSAVELEF